VKQVKRLDNLLASYDKRRTALEKQRRTTMAHLKARVLQKQNSDTMARRRADNITAQMQAYVTASATAASAAAEAAAAGRIAMNRGGGSGSGRRKGQDWTEEELKRLVDLVKVHGRCVAAAVLPFPVLIRFFNLCVNVVTCAGRAGSLWQICSGQTGQKALCIRSTTRLRAATTRFR
jgi:hypothetical protein